VLVNRQCVNLGRGSLEADKLNPGGRLAASRGLDTTKSGADEMDEVGAEACSIVGRDRGSLTVDEAGVVRNVIRGVNTPGGTEEAGNSGEGARGLTERGFLMVDEPDEMERTARVEFNTTGESDEATGLGERRRTSASRGGGSIVGSEGTDRGEAACGFMRADETDSAKRDIAKR
jgi:hypothetical protein